MRGIEKKGQSLADNWTLTLIDKLLTAYTLENYNTLLQLMECKNATCYLVQG